jgi:hypothetical protein
MAGAPGFEPGNGGIKIRCLTTWLRPTAPSDCRSAPQARSAGGTIAASCSPINVGGGVAVEPDRLERDDFSSNHHPALACCLSMIPSGQVRRHVFVESRFPHSGLALAGHRQKPLNSPPVCALVRVSA